jgi:hypothetical protein
MKVHHLFIWIESFWIVCDSKSDEIFAETIWQYAISGSIASFLYIDKFLLRWVDSQPRSLVGSNPLLCYIFVLPTLQPPPVDVFEGESPSSRFPLRKRPPVEVAAWSATCGTATQQATGTQASGVRWRGRSKNVRREKWFEEAGGRMGSTIWVGGYVIMCHSRL